MAELDSSSARLRMSVLAAVAFALFMALFARVWFLQIMSEQEFVALADGNTERSVVELAPRGRILDAQGRILVNNRPSIVITIDKEIIAANNVSGEELDDLFFQLADEISATGKLTKVAEIEAAYDSDRFGPFAEVPVVRDVSEGLQTYLAERSHEFPGVNSQVVLVRSYPYGELAAHMLGYVGALNEAEFAAKTEKGHPKQYQPNDEIGKSGVELFYEDQLRGTPGFREIEVDRFSNVVAVLTKTDPIAGSDVRLTIDIDVQALAEEELADGLSRARAQEVILFNDQEPPEYHAPAGAVVILDPSNGDVVAMASYPTYDPGLFVNGIAVEDFEALNDAENDLPLLNRAIQGEYAPGSTFKPFTTYAALDTGLIGSRGVLDVNSIYQDEGIYWIPNCSTSDCRFTNARSEALHEVDLRLALTLSSDTYYYNLAANFDRLAFDTDSVQQAAKLFGFGSPTGITLPSETSGLMPTPASVAAAYEATPELFIGGSEGRWTTGMTLNTSIGQGDVLASPLQVANAYAVVANGGTLYAPNLGAAVVDPITGEVETEFGPRVVRELYWPRLISDPIGDGLAGVTTYGPDDLDRKGTALTAFAQFPHDEWRIAGKTGTSEKASADADTAVFVGFGPLPNPEYVGVAILEEAGFGGAFAAPVISRIFERIALGTVPERLTEDEQDKRDERVADLFERGFSPEEIEDILNGDLTLTVAGETAQPTEPAESDT